MCSKTVNEFEVALVKSTVPQSFVCRYYILTLDLCHTCTCMYDLFLKNRIKNIF